MARSNLSRLLAGKSKTGLSREQNEALGLWRSDPWLFFTAEWEGKPLIWTRDEVAPAGEKVKPFPHWPFLKVAAEEIRALSPEGTKAMAIWKSRRTFISALTLLIAFHESLFVTGSNWITSKLRQEDAEVLMRDKIQFSYNQMPEWFRRLHPVNFTLRLFTFEATQSYISAVAGNFHETAARGQGGNVFVDEACFLPLLQESYEAAYPMAQRIIMCSTPGMNGTNQNANMFFKSLIFGDTVDEDPLGVLVDGTAGLR